MAASVFPANSGMRPASIARVACWMLSKRWRWEFLTRDKH